MIKVMKYLKVMKLFRYICQPFARLITLYQIVNTNVPVSDVECELHVKCNVNSDRTHNSSRDLGNVQHCSCSSPDPFLEGCWKPLIDGENGVRVRPRRQAATRQQIDTVSFAQACVFNTFCLYTTKRRGSI